MEVGDLYRVVATHTHQQCQFGDLVIFLLALNFGSTYVEGVNIKTQRRHAYLKADLEALCK